jgi:hypothetical protein
VAIGSRETLFGDDAESDAFIYSLYADVVAGKLQGEELTKVLGTTGCYSRQIAEIQDAMESIVHENPVQRIIIHLDQRTPPISFSPFFPRVVPIYNHLQTAIVLVLDDTLPATCIRAVGRDLLGQYGFDEQRLTNLAEDILRRRRIYHEPSTLEELADELRTMDPADTEDDSELTAQTDQLIDAIADRADYLRTRPLPDTPVRTVPRTDYLELWKLETERREEAKRARKLAAKISRDQEREAAAAAKQRG